MKALSFSLPEEHTHHGSRQKSTIEGLADFDFTHDGDEIDEDYSVGLLRRNRTEELEGAELPLPPR